MTTAKTPTNTGGIIAQAANQMQQAANEKTPSQIMNQLLNNAGTKKLLEGSLKENAGAFSASLIELYKSDGYLQQCNPNEVLGEALKAVSLKLPINKNLGFAWVVPRKNNKKGGIYEPQFQIGYKGYIQLAQRTGAYKYINADVVYEGELKGQNKLTGEIDLSGEAVSDNVIGYFAYIETVNGFKKSLYWSDKKLRDFATKKSDAYRGGGYSPWKTDFEEMAKKTVLKQLLSRYGVMSIEMMTAFDQEAVAEMADQKIAGTDRDAETSASYDVVEAEFTEVPDNGQVSMNEGTF